jgi:hypothetical protein
MSQSDRWCGGFDIRVSIAARRIANVKSKTAPEFFVC